MRFQTRMDAVQAPIIAVIGGISREVPGTISLGQGVVHYGPPQAAIDAVRGALTDASTHEYQDGAGLPALIERLAAKLRAENGIDVAAGARVMVTAGANMAFIHAVFAITAPPATPGSRTSTRRCFAPSCSWMKPRTCAPTC